MLRGDDALSQNTEFTEILKDICKALQKLAEIQENSVSLYQETFKFFLEPKKPERYIS